MIADYHIRHFYIVVGISRELKLFHINSQEPSKQPCTVGKYYYPPITERKGLKLQDVCFHKVTYIPILTRLTLPWYSRVGTTTSVS